jgi:hypothetical protein
VALARLSLVVHVGRRLQLWDAGDHPAVLQYRGASVFCKLMLEDSDPTTESVHFRGRAFEAVGSSIPG